MGLDMYAFTRNSEITTPVDFKSKESDQLITQWRKHPDLHGWMEALYLVKGGDQDFNCANLLLTNEDLDLLEKAIRKNSLPKTVGFFFGSSEPENKKEDLEFIELARTAISEGKSVYYTSWW